MGRLVFGLLVVGLSVSCAPTDPSPPVDVPKRLAAEGDEFQINAYTPSVQGHPSVAADKAGNSVVVWQSAGPDGSGFGVVAQLFDPAGTPRGSEFQVNSYTASHQFEPSAASDRAGNFVVAWTSALQDGSGAGVFAQRFDALGTLRGPEFQVNSYTTSYQYEPTAASDARGNFVVAWTSRRQDGSGTGIFAQRYDASGAPLGSELRVNTFTSGYQRLPSVASDAIGNFVVVWQSYRQERVGDKSWGVFAQRYDASGTPSGSEFQVNTYSTSDQYKASVASDAGGNFVVAWESYYQGIFARWYDATGAASGAEFRVETYTTGYQSSPRVAVAPGGSFVVVWESRGDGSSGGVFGQCFDAAGVARGPQFQLNAYTTADQVSPSVAVDGAGDIIAAWSGAGAGDTSGVFGRRLSCAPSMAAEGDAGAVGAGGEP